MKKNKNRFLTAGLFLLLAPFSVAQESKSRQRTWEAVNGNKVEAELLSVSEGQVTLKMKAGKTFKVPLNKLSKADQDFILAGSVPPSPKEEPKGAEGIAAIVRMARELRDKVDEADFRALLKDAQFPAR